MKTVYALVVLMVVSTAVAQQIVKYPPCNGQSLSIIAPDGGQYDCTPDGWKKAYTPASGARPDWMPSWFTGAHVAVGVAFLFIIGMLSSCSFVIHTKQAGVVERMGKFNRIAEAGLNFKLPFLESLVYTEDLNMQLMDVPVASKTKDDATVTIPVRVQYYVLAEKVKEAYYELDDPTLQIKAHVENVILSFIPGMTLDETYSQETQIAVKIREVLTQVMSKFGYAIENALVTKIVPADKVVAAMNDINAARRELEATRAKAEANKISVIAEAEAEKQAQILAGEGVAGEQKAIVDGLRDSLKDFEEGAKGVTASEAMTLIMMARYFDTIKEIGQGSNTILIPHSPSIISDLYGQLRDSITIGNVVADKANREKA